MCTIWPGTAKTRSLKGTAASFFLGAQRWDAEDHHNHRGVDQKQGGTQPGRQGPALWHIPIGQAASTVGGDEIQLFVQITAKPREESVWLETTTEVIRRSSDTTAADWLTGKAAAAALRCPGKCSRVCKLDFPQLHFTAPTGLERKTLRGAGACAWGEFSTPSCPLVAVDSVTHRTGWARRGRRL